MFWFHNNVQDHPNKTISESGIFQSSGMEPSDPHFSFILSNSVVQPHKFQQPLGQIWSLISECITKLPKHKYSLSVLYATKKAALWSRISWPILGHWWYQSKGEKWPFSPTICLKKERLFKKQSKNNPAWKFYTFFSQKVDVHRFKKNHIKSEEFASTAGTEHCSTVDLWKRNSTQQQFPPSFVGAGLSD